MMTTASLGGAGGLQLGECRNVTWQILQGGARRQISIRPLQLGLLLAGVEFARIWGDGGMRTFH